MDGVEATRSALTHPALSVRAIQGASPKPRSFFQISGWSPPIRYLVHNSSIGNLARGVLTRVFYVKGERPVQPPPGIYAERLRKFRNLLLKRFSSTTPITRQSFVEYYTGRRKVLYQRAVDSLLDAGVCRRDASIKAFVKAEFICTDDKPDPDPRVISPRDPRYNVEVGRYIRPIEHQIYGAIGKLFGDPTVLKGYNGAQIGRIFQEKWSKFRCPVAIGLDASRFDQHVSSQALAWEHSVYNAIYRSKELEKLLSWQLVNRVKGYTKDGKLSYTVQGSRMSGDMNTALGNCLIMCALVYAYLEERGVTGSLANNGDDCIVIIEQRDLPAFQAGLSEWFRSMGFLMKIEEPVDFIEGIEFCQTHPVWTVDGYVMVRNFPKALAKDCLSLKQLESKYVCSEWMKAVGEGGLSLTGGIPVYQDFYSSLYRASQFTAKRAQMSSSRKRRDHSVEITGGLAWLSKGMVRRYAPVDPRTRFSFYLAFGCTPDQQCAIEDEYRKMWFHHHVEQLAEGRTLPAWF